MNTTTNTTELSHKPGFYTMGKWLRLTKLTDLHHDLANRLYTACAKLSHERGILVPHVPDPDHGSSNLYHESILKEIIGVGDMYEE